MNRKVLWGCLGTGAVLFLAFSVFIYFYLVRPGMEIANDVQQLGELSALNQEIVLQDDYAPPADELLTREQVEQFARIQTAMETGLGSDYALLRSRAETLKGVWVGEDETEERSVGIREAMLAFKGLGPVLARAKELQVEALNREALSLEEYRWVRESVYNALHQSGANLYLEDFAQAMLDDGGNVPDPEPMEEAPTPNQDVVALYGDSIDRWMPFMVFGL